MSDHELAFSTFLKLLELPGPQKVVTLRGFKRGGGYNYWRPLQILAPDVVGGKLGLSDLQTKVASMAKAHQRKYNDRALTNLLKWVSRRKISPRSAPSRIVNRFGPSGLKVRLQPEVAFAMDGRSYLMHIWATNNPVLSEETLSMGLFYFRHQFRKEVHIDYQYLIFDTVKDRIFAEFNILESAADMLANQRDILNDLWSSVESESGIPTRKRRHEIETPEGPRPVR